MPKSAISGANSAMIIPAYSGNENADSTSQAKPALPSSSTLPSSLNTGTSSTIETNLRAQVSGKKVSTLNTTKSSPLSQLVTVATTISEKETRLRELQSGPKLKLLSARDLKTVNDIQLCQHQIRLKESSRAQAMEKKAQLQAKVENNAESVEKIEQQIANCHEAIERLVLERDMPLYPSIKATATAGAPTGQSEEAEAASDGATSTVSNDSAASGQVQQIDDEIAQLRTTIAAQNRAIKALKNEKKEIDAFRNNLPKAIEGIIAKARRDALRNENEFISEPLAKVREWGRQFELSELPSNPTQSDNTRIFDECACLLDHDYVEEECILFDSTQLFASEHNIQSPHLRILSMLATLIHPDLGKKLMKPVLDVKSHALHTKRLNEAHIKERVNQVVSNFIQLVNNNQKRAYNVRFGKGTTPSPSRPDDLSFGSTADYSSDRLEEIENDIRLVADFGMTTKDDIVNEIMQDVLAAVGRVEDEKSGPDITALKAKADSNKIRLDKEIPDKLGEINTDIKTLKQTIKALEAKKVALLEATREKMTPEPVPTEEYGSWLPPSGLRTTKDPDTKIAQYRGQIQKLVQDADASSLAYWKLSAEFEAATDQIALLDQEIGELKGQLDQKKIEKANQREQNEEQKRTERATLDEQLQKAWGHLTDPASKHYAIFTKLISPRALQLVRERHLDLSPADMRQRLTGSNNIDRAAIFSSRGTFLNVIVDVHRAAGKRFEQVMGAQSQDEFNAAKGREQTKNRICLHQDGAIGSGVNNLHGTGSVRAYQSCYAFEWDEESKSVRIAHLYPLIPHASTSTQLPNEAVATDLLASEGGLSVIPEELNSASQNANAGALSVKPQGNESDQFAVVSSLSNIQGKEPDLPNPTNQVKAPTPSATLPTSSMPKELETVSNAPIAATKSVSAANPSIPIQIYLSSETMLTLMFDPNARFHNISSKMAQTLADATIAVLKSDKNKYFGDANGGAGEAKFKLGKDGAVYQVSYECDKQAITTLKINGPDNKNRIHDVVIFGSVPAGEA